MFPNLLTCRRTHETARALRPSDSKPGRLGMSPFSYVSVFAREQVPGRPSHLHSQDLVERRFPINSRFKRRDEANEPVAVKISIAREPIVKAHQLRHQFVKKQLVQADFVYSLDCLGDQRWLN